MDDGTDTLRWLVVGLGEADLLVRLSTDYVFGGGPDCVSTQYEKDAPPAPLSVYGRTKRDGEDAVLAVRPDSYLARTSRVFDADNVSFVTASATDCSPGNRSRQCPIRSAGRPRSRPSSAPSPCWYAESVPIRRRLARPSGPPTRSWVCGAEEKLACPDSGPGAAPCTTISRPLPRLAR